MSNLSALCVHFIKLCRSNSHLEVEQIVSEAISQVEGAVVTRANLMVCSEARPLLVPNDSNRLAGVNHGPSTSSLAR